MPGIFLPRLESGAISPPLHSSHGRVGPPFASLTAAVRSLPKEGVIHSAAGSGWAGLAAGCLHSLSGPDHLAALTPLTFGRGQMKATLLGALWGFGHCIGQLVLGLLLLVLKDRFTQVVPALSKYSSVTVGLTLMVIGGLGLQETLHTRREAQMQLVGTGDFQLEAQEQASRVQDAVRPLRRNFSLWTLATGIVYGLQPDALFVIIPALALPTPLAAVAYMFMFVVGTVTAMGSYTAFIGATSKALDKSNGNLLTNLSGVASGMNQRIAW
ncbi:hypothetical protein WJX73_004376 [Symbiochloris irregularis]|uniref:Urease accessory protein UreH-like transmembrane domain-containing protein n=1 Tax=Symbiochloris irregularis TaxID=706552 RepID=A0AAW1PFD8_9CHLO